MSSQKGKTLPITLYKEWFPDQPGRKVTRSNPGPIPKSYLKKATDFSIIVAY